MRIVKKVLGFLEWRRKGDDRVDLVALLGRLDTLTTLSQPTTFHEMDGTLHFDGSCNTLRRSDLLAALVTHDILDAIQSGKVCPACWTYLDTLNPAVQAVIAIRDTYRAEEFLRDARTARPSETVVLTAYALGWLRDDHDPCVTTWRERVTRELDLLHAQGKEAASSSLDRTAVKRPATSSSANAHALEDELVVIHSKHLITHKEARDLASPYIVNTKAGVCLIKAPSRVANALAEAAQERSDSILWQPQSIRRANLTASDAVLDIAIDLWEPYDPIFGDLDKLIEAAQLIR